MYHIGTERSLSRFRPAVVVLLPAGLAVHFGTIAVVLPNIYVRDTHVDHSDRHEGVFMRGLATPTRRVAVVDDDPSLLNALQRLLRAASIEVEVFTSAEQFLARTAGEELGCLIVDINLPGISGIELRRQLAAAGSKVPAIFITAMRDQALERDAIHAGAVAYLQKPVPGSVLLDAIERASGDGFPN